MSLGKKVNADYEYLQGVTYFLQNILYFHTTDGFLTKGKVYYHFEEEITHRISQWLVVIYTGMGISLLRYTYVRDVLQGLDPQHFPLYWTKLLCLLRSIVLILNKEIILFMGESYFKYNSGFVAGNSNLWWDPTHKKFFGACVDNFMEHR